MKLKASICAILLSVSAIAYAAPKNSANFDLEESVRVAGVNLAPGQYKLVWEGTGANVTVNFMQGKKVVATAPATLAGAAKNDPDSIETTDASDQTKVLDEVDVKHLSFRFNSDAAPTAGN